MVHSLAGGTGSGLGARIGQALADEYGSSHVFASAISPYEAGEVIVQNYNALLSLSTLYRACDGITLLPNDDAHAVVSKLHGVADVSFQHINAVMGQQLGSLFLPSTVAAGEAIDSSLGYDPDPYLALESGNPLLLAKKKEAHAKARAAAGIPLIPVLPQGIDAEGNCSPLDAFVATVPHPAYKLLAIKTLPQIPEASAAFASHSWGQILKHLRQMLVANAPMEEGINWRIKPSSLSANISVANTLFLRGPDLEQSLPHLPSFVDPQLYASWAGAPHEPLSLRVSPTPVAAGERTATLLTNSQVHTTPLAKLVCKADEMINSGAYLHHYAAYGVEGDEIQAASLDIQQVVADYQALSES